ncbi:MAG: VWA domain-containing protein [Archangium sp.]|nr:VWA domain-containing protein [Archangium sp.]
MASSRFNAIRRRLDALAQPGPPEVSLLQRARDALQSPVEGEALQFPELDRLDHELDAAGIHTSADAKLLRELMSTKGSLGTLSQGLPRRTDAVLGEMETGLDAAERLARRGTLSAELRVELERRFRQLGRAVKVSAVFSSPVVPFSLLQAPDVQRPPPASPLVAIAEFWSTRAKQMVDDVSAKRRDVDLAHELLLRMGTDTNDDRARLRRLRLDVAAAKERLSAAPVVHGFSELTRHLRHAARKDARTAYRSLHALYERAVEANDEAVAKVASEALGALLPPKAGVRTSLEQAELRRTLGVRGAAAGKSLAPGGKPGAASNVDQALAKLAFDLSDDRLDALALATGASRFFDIEASLAETAVEAEVEEKRPTFRSVPYPTQRMTYEFTGSLERVHDFVFTHPGHIALDLASGRQMVREYVELERPPAPKGQKGTAVRVYVLDASGSMHGARARFRDAILISELNAIRVKGTLSLPFDPLYFSYFNDTPTDLTRVDSADEATQHLERLFRESPAEGQTDISLAVMAAFDSIRTARGKDPYLERATVVLVTDGEDGVDLNLIRRMRAPFQGMNIALSFISLGEENADLKSLVLEQRDTGSRAFYYHLSDAELGLVRTEFDSTWRTLMPADVEVSGDVLERLRPHLEALDAIAADRPVRAPGDATLQFDTLFPAAPAPAQASPAFVQRVTGMIDAVAEAAALAPLEHRAAEAVTLLTHLLTVYGVAVANYLQAQGAPDDALRRARERVRVLCRPLG